MFDLKRSYTTSLSGRNAKTGRGDGPLLTGSHSSLLAGGLALVTLVGAALTAAGVAPPSSPEPDKATTTSVEPAHHPREKTYQKRRWGVEVMDIQETAAGHMLEFRYKVLDAKKAKPLFERQTKPILTHERTGMKLVVPTPAKTGALRNSNPPHEGKVYWMFFANPGELVRPGDRVSVEIGEFRADGLVVR